MCVSCVGVFQQAAGNFLRHVYTEGLVCTMELLTCSEHRLYPGMLVGSGVAMSGGWWFNPRPLQSAQESILERDAEPQVSL